MTPFPIFRRAVVAVLAIAVMMSSSAFACWTSEVVEDQVDAIRRGKFADLPFTTMTEFDRYVAAIDSLNRSPLPKDLDRACEALLHLVGKLRAGDEMVGGSWRELANRQSIMSNLLYDWVKVANVIEGDACGPRTRAFMHLRPLDRITSSNDPWWRVATDMGYIPSEFLEAMVQLPGDCYFPSIEWSPNASAILCAPGDGSLGIIDLRSLAFEPVKHLNPKEGVWTASWTRNGSSIVVSTRGGELLDVHTDQASPTIVLITTSSRFDEIDVCHDGQWVLATDERHRRVHWIDINNRSQIRLDVFPNKYIQVAPFQDGSEVLYCNDGDAKWQNRTDIALEATKRSDPRHPTVFSDGSGMIWAVAREDDVAIGTTWKHDGRSFCEIPGAPTRMVFSPDGKYLAVTYQGPAWLGVIDVASSKLVWVYSWLGGRRVESMAWSPDGMRLASGHSDGVVRIWTLPEFLRVP